MNICVQVSVWMCVFGGISLIVKLLGQKLLCLSFFRNCQSACIIFLFSCYCQRAHILGVGLCQGMGKRHPVPPNGTWSHCNTFSISPSCIMDTHVPDVFSSCQGWDSNHNQPRGTWLLYFYQQYRRFSTYTSNLTCLFNFNYTSGCQVLPSCGFDLHYLSN